MGKRRWRACGSFLLAFATVVAWATPGAAVKVPTPVGDAPVFIPGTPYPDTGQDDAAKLIALNDDFILSRTAGDTELSVETAGAARAQGASKADGIQKGNEGRVPPGAAFNTAWAAVGPNPIIQVQRSDGALADVSGRVGALAIRKNGRLILGAAQGGIWTMDPGTNTWVPRTDSLPSLATGALVVAPSNDMIVYDGTGEGALSG